MNTTYPVFLPGKMIRYWFMMAVIGLGYHVKVCGQDQLLKNVIHPSPNVASLGKYGDIPVSLYTGIPDISIPLYEIRDRELSLPLSLSYHAAGVRVEEIASCVGIGWTLLAGGVVGRNVRGQPDDVSQWQSQPPANRIESIMNSGNPTLISTLVDDVQWHSRDGEADVYYFNFNGHSGKFFYDQAGNAHTYPAQGLAISPYLAGWRIITEDGTVYTFEKAEYVSSANCSGDQSVFNAWYLTSIKSSDGKREITFTYQTVNYTYTTLEGQTKYFSTNGTGGACIGNSGPCLGTQNYNTHRLSRIDFAEGYCLFNYINQRADLVDDKSLDEIVVYNKNNELKRKFRFSYSYFGSNVDGPNRYTEDQKRLKLLSVTEETPAIQNPPYVFEYNESEQLPSRLSYAQDEWGYFNAAPNNYDLVPGFFMIQGPNQVVAFPGADRKVNPSAAQAAILKKIKYPTGGETIFTYESNTVSDNYIDVHMETRDMGLYASTQAVNLPNPYDSYSDLVIPPGGATVTFYVSGLDGLWYGCDINTVQVIKDNNPTPYRTIANSLQGLSEFWPQGTYKLRLDYSCGLDSWASFSVTVMAQVPDTIIRTSRHVGGLRIKQIESRPVTGQALIKRYRYTQENDDTKSSGALVNYPDYGYNLTAQSFSQQESGPLLLEASCTYRVSTSFSNYPLATSQGSYVGYGHVIEDLGDNGENRYTYVSYTNSLGQGFPFAPVESFDWRRGFQLSTRNYTRRNGQLVLAREVLNTPTNSGEFRVYGLKTGMSGVTKVNGSAAQRYQPPPVYSFYPTITEFHTLGNTVERIYDQDDRTKYVEKTTTYIYNPQHLQLAETRTVTSSSHTTLKEELSINKKYPFDYTFSGAPSGPEAAGIKKLQDLHVANAVVEEYTTRQNRDINNVNLVSGMRITAGNITTYKPDNPYPDQMLRLETNSPVSISAFGTGSGLSGNAFVKNTNPTIADAYRPAAAFTAYDDKGNLVTQQKADDVPQTFIWGYNKQFPVAQVTNAAAKDVFYTSFEEAGEGNSADGDARTGRRSFAGSYTQSLSNLTNGGYLLTWWVKSGGTWVFQSSRVNVTGSSYTINLPGQIDEVRFHPVSAQMTTYTYELLTGITSQCDAGNHIIYYEYDAMGRLQLMRDQHNNIVKTFEYKYQQ
jgi:hypothetical protein